MTEYPGKLQIDKQFMEKLSSVLRVTTPVTHIVPTNKQPCKNKKPSPAPSTSSSSVVSSRIPPPPPPPPPPPKITSSLEEINSASNFDKNVFVVEKEFFELMIENYVEKVVKRLLKNNNKLGLELTESKRTDKKYLVERNGKKSVVKKVKPTDKILDGFVEF